MRRIERPIVSQLRRNLRQGGNRLQILVGPRQVGKTTAVEQVIAAWEGPSHYASADLPSPPDAYWIQSQWEAARQKLRASRRSTLLVLDEVQKITRWGEVVKAAYDEDRRSRSRLKVVILGSASLHVQRGASESLAGRFELHYCPHWTWTECREGFRWPIETWIYFGGYPGAAPLVKDAPRWSHYVASSLIEAVLSRDVLQLTPVVKPALLRQLFRLATHHPAQMLSYTKMLGQLQDAGNTVTLAHYLDLLSSAYLVSGLRLWSGGLSRQRASSPKLVTWNNALINAWPDRHYAAVRRRPDLWGRLVENAVGAHLLNFLSADSVYYWRDGELEIDYVLSQGDTVVALEVKSGRAKVAGGLHAFKKRCPHAKALVVGSGGIPLEQFFQTHPQEWF